ncbi:MAG: bifunctional oligoribonuclease/PAP phosphatase NrnA [Epsilonproteobacteria bacterium]|nr:MAG: bifunctional oligoribonuclease/PAP phosphatase NrnA [Campylobacterota bacterium]
MYDLALQEQEFKQKIAAYKTISILTHLNPDADTLGTALGIYILLRQDKSKKVEVVNASNALPRYLDFLPSFSKIKKQMDYSDSLIISCDCGSIDRLGFGLEGRDIVNIDHHASNTGYGSLNVILPEAASASEVAYHLLKNIYAPSKDAATCFYASLLSDTRYFTTANVDKSVFSLAYDLVNLGANPREIAANFTQRRALSSFRILEKALASLTLYREARVAVLVVSKEEIASTGASVADMEGIVDYAKSLVTVEVAIFVMEAEDSLRVSLRSKTVDVSGLASFFQGGGHKLASGFTLKTAKVQESIDTILEHIKNIGLLSEK